jgi:hypothetical protein
MTTFKCQTCGTSHPAKIGWHSKDLFNAVPPRRECGDWACPLHPDRPYATYRKADLTWKEEPAH